MTKHAEPNRILSPYIDFESVEINGVDCTPYLADFYVSKSSMVFKFIMRRDPNSEELLEPEFIKKIAHVSYGANTIYVKWSWDTWGVEMKLNESGIESKGSRLLEVLKFGKRMDY